MTRAEKQGLTETNTRTQFTMPALIGPNEEQLNAITQVREEACSTEGRGIVRGKLVRYI